MQYRKALEHFDGSVKKLAQAANVFTNQVYRWEKLGRVPAEAAIRLWLATSKKLPLDPEDYLK